MLNWAMLSERTQVQKVTYTMVPNSRQEETVVTEGRSVVTADWG